MVGIYSCTRYRRNDRTRVFDIATVHNGKASANRRLEWDDKICSGILLNGKNQR